MNANSAPTLLSIEGVSKVYDRGRDAALRDFNLTIPAAPATITAIAGESGSGKTTLANIVLGFVTPTEGTITFQGSDIARLNRREKLQYRREVQAVFQDPYEVYNPYYRVRHIFDIVIRNFRLARNRAEAQAAVEDACEVVGLRAADVLNLYPHQLSGGQRQRLMIARAYLLKPKLIVADEPVSMVDASLRSMILEIMLRLRDEFGISFLYITHDLSTALQIADQLYVLYRGETVEHGKTAVVIEQPKHPYVQLLVDSIPVPDPSVQWDDLEMVQPAPVSLQAAHQGCKFYARCPHRMARCLDAQPPLFPIGDAAHPQSTACYLYEPGRVLVESPRGVLNSTSPGAE